MNRWMIDTNVPVVANGGGGEERPVSLERREAAIHFLRQILDRNDHIVVDHAGEIQKEYHENLYSGGQPGVGFRFYLRVLQDWILCERIDLPKRADGEYADLPQAVIDEGFDRSDRKFAALAKRERIPVVNAVDTDWLEAQETLTANGIRVKFLCGCDERLWREP